MSHDTSKAASFWDEETKRRSTRQTRTLWWEANSEFTNRLNTIKVTGDADKDWQQYTLETYFDGRFPLNRVLSLGCGTGYWDRNLAEHNGFRFMDAYDVSSGSIEKAKSDAHKADITNINYQVEDLNTFSYPENTYDAVWITGAMHHFRELEHVSRSIHHTLKPGGFLIMHGEYIGPDWLQYSRRQQEVANLCLRLLPKRYRHLSKDAIAPDLSRSSLKKGPAYFVSRIVDKARDGDLMGVIWRRMKALNVAAKPANTIMPTKDSLRFPSARDVESYDPSEAVRASEIMTVIARDFDIVEKTDLGCNMVMSILNGIAHNFNDDNESLAMLMMIQNIEQTLIAAGDLESNFSYIVARPKGK